jgi:hypothetical protein
MIVLIAADRFSGDPIDAAEPVDPAVTRLWFKSIS